jgi:hypothetical protein
MLCKLTHGKTTLLAFALGGVLMLGGAAPAQARDRDDKCSERIRKAEENLRRDIEHHGERSRQAEKRRHQLDEARDRCHDSRDRDRSHDRDRDRDR